MLPNRGLFLPHLRISWASFFASLCMGLGLVGLVQCAQQEIFLPKPLIYSTPPKIQDSYLPCFSQQKSMKAPF